VTGAIMLAVHALIWRESDNDMRASAEPRAAKTA
jgi:hypothetical protein